MSNQDDITKLIKSISGQANILTIPRIYIRLTKSHRSALFLSQSVYWSDKSNHGDGWFYKSYREWRDELGLNQHAVETCVKTLEEGGWLETKVDRVGIRETRFYRPILGKIAESIKSTLAESAKVTLAESAIEETSKVPKRKTIRSSIKHRLPSETTEDSTDKPHADCPSTTREIQDAYIQELGYKPDTWSAGEGAAAKAIAAKWTVEQFVKAYRHLKAQSFWGDKLVRLSYLKQQIPEILKNGNGKVTHGSTSYSGDRTPEDQDRISAHFKSIARAASERARRDMSTLPAPADSTKA